MPRRSDSARPSARERRSFSVTTSTTTGVEPVAPSASRASAIPAAGPRTSVRSSPITSAAGYRPPDFSSTYVGERGRGVAERRVAGELGLRDRHDGAVRAAGVVHAADGDPARVGEGRHDHHRVGADTGTFREHLGDHVGLQRVVPAQRRVAAADEAHADAEPLGGGERVRHDLAVTPRGVGGVEAAGVGEHVEAGAPCSSAQRRSSTSQRVSTGRSATDWVPVGSSSSTTRTRPAAATRRPPRRRAPPPRAGSRPAGPPRASVLLLVRSATSPRRLSVGRRPPAGAVPGPALTGYRTSAQRWASEPLQS